MKTGTGVTREKCCYRIPVRVVVVMHLDERE